MLLVYQIKSQLFRGYLKPQSLHDSIEELLIKNLQIKSKFDNFNFIEHRLWNLWLASFQFKQFGSIVEKYRVHVHYLICSLLELAIILQGGQNWMKAIFVELEFLMVEER